MRRLSLQLQLAIENSEYTRSEICEICEIAPATLSKYINGKMQPRRDALTRLSKVIPKEHIASVYSAYLLDALPDDCEQYITITEKPISSKVREKQTTYNAPKLPKELESALSELRTLASKSPVAAEFMMLTYKMMKNVDLTGLSVEEYYY